MIVAAFLVILQPFIYPTYMFMKGNLLSSPSTPQQTGNETPGEEHHEMSNRQTVNEDEPQSVRLSHSLDEAALPGDVDMTHRSSASAV